jgi:hypothetical protein
MHNMASLGSCDRKGIEMIAFYNFSWPKAWISWNESLQFESGLTREGNYYGLERERIVYLN